ncbi:MAG: hypothetical protein ABFR95_09945 [Actinomycetota bacterium]
MRRFVIVLAVAALAVGMIALPSAANNEPTPDDIVFASGETTFGAVMARTGEPAGNFVPLPFLRPGWEHLFPGWQHLMDPDYNRCTVVSATLTWIEQHTYELATHEECPLFPPRYKTWDVRITPGGAVKMTNKYPPPLVNGKHWLVERTGCELNGTFRMYHGHFDGEHLYAASHFHGICDGGTVWGNAHHDVGHEDGPIHATFDISLYVGD